MTVTLRGISTGRTVTVSEADAQKILTTKGCDFEVISSTTPSQQQQPVKAPAEVAHLAQTVKL